MKQTSLRDILRGMVAHPPKKLNASLISDIHAKCTTEESLADLLASKFFQKVAWRFFHADVTNSHIELILQIATYEYEVLCKQTCLDLIQEDNTKLGSLLSRILQSTMSYRKQDARLQSCTFLFLRVLMSAVPSELVAHPLFPKWKHSMFESYANALSKPPVDGQSASLLHCYHSFGLACVIAPSEQCQQIISDPWFPLRFTSEEFDYKTRRLATLTMLLRNPQTEHCFTSLQLAIEKEGLQGKVPSIEAAASRYDVHAEDLKDNLNSLTNEELTRLAVDLGISARVCAKDTVSIITYLVIGNELSYTRQINFTAYNENDVFDVHESSGQVVFMPRPTIPSFVPYSSLWVVQIAARNAYRYLESVNKRAINVLNRLEIIDPSAERGIKGTSKYFSEIQAIDVVGSKAYVKLKNKKLYDSLREGCFILLLELQKPNRHGGVSRMVKSGVNTCAITKVHSHTGKLSIEWHSTGFGDRFNALISIPSPLHQAGSSPQNTLPIKFSEKAASAFTASNVDANVLEAIGAELNMKKRKVDGGNAGSESLYRLNDCEITIPKSPVTNVLSEDLSRALLTMLSEKISVIAGANGSEKYSLINAFVASNFINWSEEACLIVLPTKSAVDLYQVDEEISNLCFKHDTNDCDLYSKIKKVGADLERVSELSVSMGLADYDFKSSIRNALMLYHVHVEPAWRKYLKQLTRENIAEYPFAQIQNNEFSEILVEVVDHYSSIRTLFSQLEEVLPLDKYNLQGLKPDEISQIRRYFSMQKRCIIIAEEDLNLVDRQNDNVIIHSVSSIPLIKGHPRRLVSFGSTNIDWGSKVSVNYSVSREEMACLTGKRCTKKSNSFNPGFRFCMQHIKLPKQKQGLNIDEAKYCILLYKYMRLMGYPTSRISIAVKSEQMRCLIEEILSDHKIGRADRPCDDAGAFCFGWPIIQNVADVFPTDYLIVSCSGIPTLEEYNAMAESARLGLYLVGSESDHTYKIRTGHLEVVQTENYLTREREAPNAKEIINAAEFESYVRSLMKKEN
ncbi:hypothetical protein OY671_003431 [Metschnikowia pulcherrima]|nr:hypothetical protein OY671_003431 [Metschnikowia pulcherrima]